MHSQTLISTLVWAALLWSTRVVSDVLSDEEKRELVNKLNTLVRHSGWQFMGDVKIFKKKRKELADPVSEILEAISSNREPVDESNVLIRHMEIWTVLMCKYGDIIFNYKNLVNYFIRTCQNQKSPFDLFRSYYGCFDLLLTKIHSMTPRFQCMADALNIMYSLGPQFEHKYLLPAVQKLTDYTSTLKPNTMSLLSERGTTEAVVDHEIIAISEYVSGVFKKNIYWFTFDHCKVSKNHKWNVLYLAKSFLDAKSQMLIPQETTMVQYVKNEYDDFVSEILGKWFYDLGFAYGVEGKVLIATN